MGKRVVVLIFVFVLWLTSARICMAEELKESDLYARSACLLDAQTGRVLYMKNGTQQMPMASTTKLMTCILALELGHANDVVKVSQRAARQPKVHMGASEGEEFLLKDLLYTLMLESHNDAAVMIAEHIAGSVENFADMMNRKAKEIGCENTYFITPNGLDAEDEHGVHSTTAVDLARIMKYCITQSEEKDLFLEITKTPAYTFWNCAKTKLYQCTNHNAFLHMMEGALTGKTGYTNDAGYCYVGALRSGDETYIVSLLACGWPNNKNYKWLDTKKMMTYGLENYAVKDVFEQKEFAEIEVKNGQSQKIGEIPTLPIDFGEEEILSIPLLMREAEEIEVIYDIPTVLTAPIRRGEQIGTVSYYIEGIHLKTYAVYAQKDVKEIDFSWCLDKIIGIYRM